MLFSGIIVIVQFVQVNYVKVVFGKFVYCCIKDSVLFLEKVLKDFFSSDVLVYVIQFSDWLSVVGSKLNVNDLLLCGDRVDEEVDIIFFFVCNLNFVMLINCFVEVFVLFDGFVLVCVKMKMDFKKFGQMFSMGFGFVEFCFKEQV